MDGNHRKVIWETPQLPQRCERGDVEMMDLALRAASAAMSAVEKEGMEADSECRIPCRLTEHKVIRSTTSYAAGKES